MWNLPRKISLDDYKILSFKTTQIKKYLFFTHVLALLETLITYCIAQWNCFAAQNAFTMLYAFETNNYLMVFSNPSKD